MFRRSVSWIDIGLRERMTILTSVAGAPLTYPALVILSNAAPTSWHEGDWQSATVTTPPVVAYPSVDAVVVMTLEDAVNHRGHVLVPAPELAKLQADRINADMTAFEWTQLEADTSSLSNPFSGLPYVTLLDACTVFRGSKVYETYANYNGGITWARRANQWRDTLGHGVIHYLAGPIGSLTGAPTLQDITDDEQAVSTAVVTDFWEGEMTVFPTPTPTTDQYNSVNDYAKMVFQDYYGNRSTVMVPAPNRYMFLTDGKTVNAAQANVATFIGAAISELVVPTSGLPFNAFVGGVLVKARGQGYQ